MYTTLRSGKPGSIDATILLVPKLKRLTAADRPEDDRLAKAFETARKRPEFTADVGSFVEIGEGRDRVLVLSIGETEKNDAQAVRVAAGKVTAALHARQLASIELILAPTVTKTLDAKTVASAFTEGLGLAAFRYERFKKNANAKPTTLTLRSRDAATRRAITEGAALAESTNFARELQATPPNVATPYYIAYQAKKLAAGKGSRLKCTVFRGDALKKNKFVGLVNVGQASDHKPCMIQLEYRSKKANAPTVVLIGKTLTFDTGGLSLKINNGMRTMKYDKSGGTAVLGTMHAIRNRDLPCHVIALLPAAENAISDEAYRPDDILEYPNGVSVEVTNTDAEGRLVLADALHYASRKFRPAAIIDLATLTGAIVAALGDHMAGLFCADDTLRDRVRDAAG
ncbi:MAG: M17 family peptidase N-terminal domain-containing protein, partial [Phycisphaeraceae bacterium]